jgi:predicted ribosomally synthesized peptide with nif11-like leader
MSEVNNQQMQEKLKNATTLDDLKNILSENGVELTDQQLDNAFEKLSDYHHGKLSDDELEQVDGGFGENFWKDFWKCVPLVGLK